MNKKKILILILFFALFDIILFVVLSNKEDSKLPAQELSHDSKLPVQELIQPSNFPTQNLDQHDLSYLQSLPTAQIGDDEVILDDQIYERHERINIAIEQKNRAILEQKNRAILEQENKVILNDKEKELCLRDFEEINDNRLLGEIINGSNDLYKLKKVTLDRYFSCRIDDINVTDRDQEVDQYIAKNNISNDFKEYLMPLDEKYRDVYDSLFLMLAFSDVETLCTLEVAEHCYGTFLKNLNNSFPYMCEDMCNKTKNLVKKENYYNAAVLNYQWFNPDKQHLYDPKLFESDIEYLRWWRIAFSYRVGGRDESNSTCDVFNEDDKKYCLDFVDSRVEILEQYDKYREECSVLVSNLENFVCR